MKSVRIGSMQPYVVVSALGIIYINITYIGLPRSASHDLLLHIRDVHLAIFTHIHKSLMLVLVRLNET